MHRQRVAVWPSDGRSGDHSDSRIHVHNKSKTTSLHAINALPLPGLRTGPLQPATLRRKGNSEIGFEGKKTSVESYRGFVPQNTARRKMKTVPELGSFRRITKLSRSATPPKPRASGRWESPLLASRRKPAPARKPGHFQPELIERAAHDVIDNIPNCLGPVIKGGNRRKNHDTHARQR